MGITQSLQTYPFNIVSNNLLVIDTVLLFSRPIYKKQPTVTSMDSPIDGFDVCILGECFAYEFDKTDDKLVLI